MSLNESPSGENHELDSISMNSVTKSHCTGLHNNTVDFIEMLTLDAKEFLTIKCVCKMKSDTQQDFCKDCFRNYKGHTDNVNKEIVENKSLQIDEPSSASFNANDDNFIISEANGSCEVKFLDNRLLNAREIAVEAHNDGEQKPDYKTSDRCDKTNNKNCYANCATEPEPINSSLSCTCTMATKINIDKLAQTTEARSNDDPKAKENLRNFVELFNLDKNGESGCEQQEEVNKSARSKLKMKGIDSTVEMALEKIVLKYLQVVSEQKHCKSKVDVAQCLNTGNFMENSCEAPDIFRLSNIAQKCPCNLLAGLNHSWLQNIIKVVKSNNAKAPCNQVAFAQSGSQLLHSGNGNNDTIENCRNIHLNTLKDNTDVTESDSHSLHTVFPVKAKSEASNNHGDNDNSFKELDEINNSETDNKGKHAIRALNTTCCENFEATGIQPNKCGHPIAYIVDEIDSTSGKGNNCKKVNPKKSSVATSSSCIKTSILSFPTTQTCYSDAEGVTTESFLKNLCTNTASLDKISNMELMEKYVAQVGKASEAQISKPAHVANVKAVNRPEGCSECYSIFKLKAADEAGSQAVEPSIISPPKCTITPTSANTENDFLSKDKVEDVANANLLECGTDSSANLCKINVSERRNEEDNRRDKLSNCTSASTLAASDSELSSRKTAHDVASATGSSRPKDFDPTSLISPNCDNSLKDVNKNDVDLDPNSVLKHVANPASPLSNSSEKLPSSRSDHRQQSAYGESCASRGSIGSDGRSQEQAPICSREFAVDVVVSDAAECRVSQTCNPAAVNLLLTETPSDRCQTAQSEQLKHTNHQIEAEKQRELTWEFRNGRLVFAESKCNLGITGICAEQVVCSPNATSVADGSSLVESFPLSFAERVNKLLESPVKVQGYQSLADGALDVNNQQPIREFNTSLIASARKELEPPVPRISNCSTDGLALSSDDILSSKHINKRAGDSSSRLKYIEDKLKKAGITDAKSHSDALDYEYCQEYASLVPNLNCANTPSKEEKTEPDNNNNRHSFGCSFEGNSICDCGSFKDFSKTHQYVAFTETLEEKNSDLKVTNYSDFQKAYTNFVEEQDGNKGFVNKSNIEAEDFIPDGFHDFCQFNVNDFTRISTIDNSDALGIYDEFIEDTSSDESCACDEDDHFIVIRRTRGDGIAMVNESLERNKHNPDRDNLKSLLKKPGHPNGRKSNRVVFNEKKNEFFDADYIILIREDCELDDDDDDGICTCQQHEMVRLTCCEPNCNCQYEGGIEPTPQSPKFAPPMEFVDAVTLSPPEGYKDMELMAATRGQQRGAVCRECSATHEGEIEEGDASQSDSEMDGQVREQEEKEKTDQSQQTTPTTPPSSGNSNNQNYILGTMSMGRLQSQYQNFKETEVSERSLLQGSPISGILKGGRLWKQQSQLNTDSHYLKNADVNIVSSDSVTSDEETSNRRSVRFIESEERGKRDSCDGAPESSPDEETRAQKDRIVNEPVLPSNNKQEVVPGSSPDAPEMTLTFKLGNHVLISNNSLKPNSAVRQLFPCTKSLAAAQGVEEEENSQQYLVTAESLRAFEEAKRSKLPQIIQSGETDETIKRAIERNTLRRSLIRYEPRSKKQPYKSDNSLVERIKQLTCDMDDNGSRVEQSQSSIETNDQPEDGLDSRTSPPGEESRNSPDVNTLSANKTQDKSFSPSSSSTTSSNSSMSINQNYQQARKLSANGEQVLMIDPKRAETLPDVQNNFRREIKPMPDIGGPHNHESNEPLRMIPANLPDIGHCVVSNKMSSSSNTSESRRQFLSTLAPLTACVTMGVAHNEDYYYHLSNSQPGERFSVASSGTEYSLEDIDEGLKTEDEEHKRIAPDVLAGTPSASESGDELAMFVQQDAGRIERIKKKYQPAEQAPKDNKANQEDDENDDYGFNRRPSVRGIKPKFSTTTEILQQIQNQLQPPPPPSARVAWPYYSESGLTDNSKHKNANVPSNNYQYINMSEDAKTRNYPPQYRPASLQEESLYQNCANQRCVSRAVYERSNANVFSSVIRMGNDYYQPVPLTRPRNGRPQSPPPMDMSKQFHQTMVYIPYNHIEGYQPVQYYHQTGANDYITRVSSQNQINKRYIEPVYQSRAHHHVDDHHYNSNMIPPVPPKVLNRVSYPNGQPPSHAVISGSRSESPLTGNASQFSTARSTQTPGHTMSTCGYYPSNPRYRPVVGPVWQGESNYSGKVNRHSFPSVGPRYPPADNVSLTDSDSQHSGSLPNGYRQSDMSLYASKDSIPNSPTKPRFIERGVPEGAASVSPQDISGISQSSSSTMTSPTSPQNPPVPANQKAMFYAMNV